MAMQSHGAASPVETQGRSLSPARIRIARILALAADAIQLGLFPAFGPGALSLLNDGLDIVVAVVMVGLVGWNFAFLPTFVAELIPGVDLIPTWTLAVWFATRHRAIEPPGPGGPVRK
jgi:hypothetical protein